MLYAKRNRIKTDRIGKLFSRLPLTPNQWSILSILIVVFSFYFLINESFIIAASLFLLSAFLDVIDGSVARFKKGVTKFGAYLDTIIDRYVEAIIIFGLLLIPLPEFIFPSYMWLFLYFFGSFMTTYAKSAAFEKKLVRKELSGGFLERAERMIILFLGILLASVSKVYLVYVIVILAVLSNLTTIQRFSKVK